MSSNGHATTGRTRIGIPVVDIAPGLSAIIVIPLTLAERERSGEGQCRYFAV
jgi:crotonobetainyl-CoA:carnitine CoA-transferase CaiB-like acyl-CoA transferase